MEKQKNIPELRFPGFDEEWGNISLESVCTDVMYGMNASATTFDGKHKYLRITDIDENTREFKPNPLTSPAGKIDSQFKLKMGDIVFARTGASVGKSYLYNEEDGELYFAGFLIKFSVKDANPYFTYIQTLRSAYYKWVMIMSMRSGQPGINAEEYKTYKFNFPTLPEQQKIASFFTAIDKKISQLKQKKTLLEQYKKGVMQKIFSQEIRFRDENGQEFPKWEKKRLGEIANFFKGKGISKSEVSIDGTTECIRYGELYTYYNETIDKVKSKTNIHSKELVFSQSNDIIIPASGETQIDIATASCVLRSGIALGGDLNIIRTENNGVFLSYYLNNYKKNDIANLAQGISVVHLYSSQLSLLEVEIPSLAEQSKIAIFISSIDIKIDLIQTQIKNAELWKKGLLEKMFV